VIKDYDLITPQYQYLQHNFYSKKNIKAKAQQVSFSLTLHPEKFRLQTHSLLPLAIFV